MFSDNKTLGKIVCSGKNAIIHDPHMTIGLYTNFTFNLTMFDCCMELFSNNPKTNGKLVPVAVGDYFNKFITFKTNETEYDILYDYYQISHDLKSVTFCMKTIYDDFIEHVMPMFGLERNFPCFFDFDKTGNGKCSIKVFI
jgi:hypothetical protein